MLVRHAFALVATLLATRLVRAGDDADQQFANALDSSANVWLVEGYAQGGYSDVVSEGHFCPLRLRGRYHSWYFQADSLILHRTNGISRPLAAASDSSATVLESGDLDLGFRPGLRLLVGHRTGADRGWELSYFALFDRASISVADPNNLDIAGTLRSFADDYSNADRIAFRHAATLHNAEANLVFDGDTRSVLVGLRFFHLNETALLTASDRDSGTSNYTVHTQNDLAGPQFGFRTGRFNHRWGWELTTKAGLFGSLMRQQQLLLDDGNTFIRRRDSARAGSTALFGDINVGCFRQLNDRWSVRAGYYVMYVANLALAVDQLDFDEPPISNKAVVQGDLLLHGVTFGLEARW